MDVTQIPTRFPEPFANSAGPTYTAPIPTASPGVAGRASLDTGFPPETFTPVGGGGTPPFGQDFNGLFQQITAGLRWDAAGGGAIYNAAFQTAIGGYPKGCVVQSLANPLLKWTSTVDNNTTNPDTGGAGWAVFGAGQLLGVQRFVASGTYTPTPGMRFCIVQAVGGGGGGAGAAAGSAGQFVLGSSGTAGAEIAALLTATDIGASQSVTIGAGGAGGTGTQGANGGATLLGALLAASQGVAGSIIGAATSPIAGRTQASAQTLPTGGNLWSKAGNQGGPGLGLTNGSYAGPGGDSSWGRGGQSIQADQPGQVALGFGAGGGGTVATSAGGTLTGGAGTPGLMLIFEYS